MSILKSASKFGLLLAALFVVAGGLLVARPPEMTVHHPVSQKGAHFWKRSGTEAVDHTRARIYGAGLLLFGVAVAVFSLYKPRA
jgi:hypothetical protein